MLLTPIELMAFGGCAATLVALAARRARLLTNSGAVAAILVGTAACAWSWENGALLVCYFVIANAVGRLPRARARISDTVDKTGPRDAAQVIANGGVFAALSFAAVFIHVWKGMNLMLVLAAAGALAASAADTWATEIGTAFGGTPRSILTWRKLLPGTSGGVTFAGTVATVVGAASVAAMADVLVFRELNFACAIWMGGIAGSLADSLIGALAQERRWCATCSSLTERRIHSCGAHTTVRSGIAGLDNDKVNFLATLIGAVSTVAFGGLLG